MIMSEGLNRGFEQVRRRFSHRSFKTNGPSRGELVAKLGIASTIATVPVVVVKQILHAYEVRPRKDHRGVDLISPRQIKS